VKDTKNSFWENQKLKSFGNLDGWPKVQVHFLKISASISQNPSS